MQSRRFAVVVTLVIIVAFVVVAVAPAFAATPSGLALHAQLLGSSPKDGSTVATAQQVVLTFNEDVDPTFVRVSVKGPEGSETEGKPTVSDREVTQALAADLPAGEHVVTYRVVSTDGHPVSGSVTFTSTQAPASASPSPTTTTPAPSPSASSVASPTPDGHHGTHVRELRRRLDPVAGRGGRGAAGRPRPRRGMAHHRRPEDRRRGGCRGRRRRPAPRRPDRFRPDAGRLIISASRAISSIGRAADS